MLLKKSWIISDVCMNIIPFMRAKSKSLLKTQMKKYYIFSRALLMLWIYLKVELLTDGKIKVDTETIEILLDSQQSYRLEDNGKKEGLGLPDKVL